MAGNPARKWWALVAIAASVLVVGLDLTVLNLALPTIATDLHALLELPALRKLSIVNVASSRERAGWDGVLAALEDRGVAIGWP